MMSGYTKNMFKTELIELCKVGYDPVTVAKKTSRLFHQHQSEIDLKLRNVMLDVMTMEDGPEFEMTEDEFKKFLDEI